MIRYRMLPTKCNFPNRWEDLLRAEIFRGTGVKITTSGERHLGAVIGSHEFRTEYVSDKIRKWTKDVEQLAEVAKDEPQLAYSAYTKALSMRWCFLQRTVPDTKTFFAPLEEVIRNKLIPAIIGRNITDIERKLISLPVRLGGMGIQNPCDTADAEFRNSTQVTQNLTKLIMDQETDLSNYDELEVTSLLKRIRTEKEENFILQLENLNTVLSDKVRRCVELAGEKGAGAWLSALPLQSLGYVLNKQEFRDSIYLRYGWMIPNTPAYCGCKSKNSSQRKGKTMC